MDAILGLALWTAGSLCLLCVAQLRAEQHGCRTLLTTRTIPFVLATGVASAIGAHGGIGGAIPLIATLCCSGICAASDIETGLIFNPVTGVAFAAAVATAPLHGGALAALLGGAVCGGTLLALHLASSKRGIGLGDVKAAAVIGAGSGALLGAIALGIAFVLGAICACVCLVTGNLRRRSTLRFGPYLALGSVACTVVWFGVFHA
jgi:prepilin signal peptidase PulO-like enzyme (type II secretory pathway)